jgi:SAM-dependent methyltransferase
MPVIDYREGGLANHQDVVVLRNSIPNGDACKQASTSARAERSDRPFNKILSVQHLNTESKEAKEPAPEGIHSSFQQAKVNEVWSQDPDERRQTQGWYWMAHPMVRARVNTLISGDPDCDAYSRLEQLYFERGWTLPIGKAISLGCGFGNLERDLVSRGWVRHMQAYDLAEGAIVQARHLAAEAGLSGITYHTADLETLLLAPTSVDAVFAHSSIHHVRNLEDLYATVHAALKPGGVFHLHEFVGPTRFQWTDAQLRLANEFLDSLPPRLRALPSGQPKGVLQRPTIQEMIAADPSEAIRSAELVTALEPLFELVEQRNTGGSLLHLALGDIAQNFDPASPQDRTVLLRLFALEDQAMAKGIIGSDFSIITAVARKESRTEKAENAQVMTPRFSTRLLLRFPPVRRLYGVVRHLNGSIAALAAGQEQLRNTNRMLQAEQHRLSMALSRIASELEGIRTAASPAADEPADPNP